MRKFPGIYSISGRPLSSAWVVIGKHSYYARHLSVGSWMPGEKIVIGKYCSIGDQVSIITGGNRPTHRAANYPVDVLRSAIARDPQTAPAVGLSPKIAATLAAINLVLPLFYPGRNYRTTKDTTLGNDVWVGYGAMIAGGAYVGDGAVIASGSVVFSDIPPYAIAAGNPARVIRYRFSPEMVRGLLRIRWWDWSEDKIRANLEWFHRPITEFVRNFNEDEQRNAGASGVARESSEQAVSPLAGDAGDQLGTD